MDRANTQRAWRYVRYGPLEQVLQLQQLPCPTPGADDVLVQVRHASINPLDWKLVEGRFRLFLKSKPPCGVGTEFAGMVAALGSRARGVRVGQRIEQGSFVPRVTRHYAMTDALQALLASRAGHARGKLVIDVQVPPAD